jgi:hypothetical protein
MSRSGRKFSMMPLWITVISPAAITVRMRIEIVRAAVGGPAGVGEANAGVGRPVAERVGQVR